MSLFSYSCDVFRKVLLHTLRSHDYGFRFKYVVAVVPFYQVLALGLASVLWHVLS